MGFVSLNFFVWSFMVNFVSQYSSYFSHVKELGEEGPAHGLFFSRFLSSPGKMFRTDDFDGYGMRK